MRADAADDFLKEMRKLYKRHGIPFKYIHVMEIGKKVGATSSLRLSIHQKR